MDHCTLYCVFVFFKQKTAYEMRISDWSSDVCSSDLIVQRRFQLDDQRLAQGVQRFRTVEGDDPDPSLLLDDDVLVAHDDLPLTLKAAAAAPPPRPGICPLLREEFELHRDAPRVLAEVALQALTLAQVGHGRPAPPAELRQGAPAT